MSRVLEALVASRPTLAICSEQIAAYTVPPQVQEGLSEILQALAPARMPLLTSWGSYVLRDLDHAVDWMAWIINLEFALFDRDLGGGDKRMDAAIMACGDSSLLIHFRLRTAGLAGYTGYTAAVKRLGQDEFACWE